MASGLCCIPSRLFTMPHSKTTSDSIEMLHSMHERSCILILPDNSSTVHSSNSSSSLTSSLLAFVGVKRLGARQQRSSISSHRLLRLLKRRSLPCIRRRSHSSCIGELCCRLVTSTIADDEDGASLTMERSLEDGNPDLVLSFAAEIPSARLWPILFPL